MAAAARWLEENAGKHERFFLFVDEFDPHEPFDTPEDYARRYDPAWSGPHLIWPPYARDAVAKGILTAREGQQIRAQYGAKLTMIDAWFGRVLDAIDRTGTGGDTAIYLCTDHGHYLGEKDIWGKPASPAFQPIAQIPLMIAAPGVAPGTCDALTTSVDLFASLCDQFGVEGQTRQRSHGASLWPLLADPRGSVRDFVLSGVWGREVHYIDRQTKYARAPVAGNAPLAMYSNRWSTMPTHFLTREQELPLPDRRATLSHMPDSAVPVLRQVWEAGDRLPYWAYAKFSGHHLYDLADDPGEARNLAGDAREQEAARRLAGALRSVMAPETQFTRLGL
jgi:arylsulfatase A-like enzyme